MRKRLLWMGIICLGMAGLTMAQNKPAIEKAELREVASWQGDGTKNTESFTITKREWYVVWATSPGEYGDMNFQIYVYREANEELVGLAANIIGKGQDYSVYRGVGKYYLMINSGQPYKVSVYEPK